VEQDEECEDAVGGGANDRGHGAELGRPLGVTDGFIGETAHAMDEEEYDPLENEGEEKNGEQAGETGADKFDYVGVPVVLDNIPNAFILLAEVFLEHH
jgi:hypothetical protein